MNALTAYALARRLGPLLEGRTVESASRFAGGMTVEFSGHGRRFVHILSAGRESEVLVSGDRLMPEGVCSPAFGDLVSATALSAEPLGLDRVILMHFEEKGSWGEGGRLTLRIDVSPVFRSAALFRRERTGRSRRSARPARARHPLRFSFPLRRDGRSNRFPGTGGSRSGRKTAAARKGSGTTRGYGRSPASLPR